MSNASNLSTLANVLDDGSDGQFLKSTGSGGVAFDTVAAGAVVYATADLLPLSGNSAGDMAYVTATNRFYINNGSGWYSVSLVNTNPNITSVQDAGSNTTPFTLATDQTATVITITAADPEEVPLTYGYSVTSGSLNGSTVAQGTGSNSNVFTVTPHASQDATFTLTFTASDGINQATSANEFSLSFVTIVTDSNHTTLLATATGTSDNNNITDSSSNNHSISVNGDAHAGTFSPYRSGGYSTYFAPSSNDYIDFTGSKSAIGTGDFSVSFWMYPTAGNDKTIIDTRSPNSTYAAFDLYIGGNDNLYYRSRASGGTYTSLVSGSAVDLYKWSYVLINRTNNTTTMYINGVSKANSTSMNVSYAPPTGLPRIGMRSDASSWDFEGYIRDVHIQTGAVSTPTNVPTEAAIVTSDTYLLACHLPYFKDGSTSNYTVSVGGTPSLKPFSPYDYNEYAATDHGGSVYFDGSGDTIGTYHTSNLQLGASSAFTLEFWFYANGTSSDYQSLFSTYSGSSVTDAGQSARLIFNTSNNLFIMTDGSSNFLQITKNVPQNVWNHFCWTRDASNNHKFYLNGEQIGTSTTSTNFQTDWWYFAQRKYNGDQEFTGYISDISLIKGSVTRSSAFTPPTAPLSSSGTSLHIKGTDASIIDKSQGANLKLVGDTTGSTTQAKFSNTKSMKFDGTGDYISIPADDSIFSKDYTIEFWMYPTQDTNLKMPFSKGVGLQFYHQSGNIAAALSWNNSSYSYNGNFGSITTNAWSHISLVRDSSANTYKFYINGTLEDTVNSSSNINAGSANWIIGGYQGASYNFQGYLQDLRITEGKAHYTANFTPPSAPLEG